MKKIHYYFIISIIIIISFLLYSSNFYPLLGSDDALNILMAYYYKLPADFYCWGQDRGGTLIPLISQVFIKIFHISSLTSVSLSNYLILILGFIGVSSLFKTTFSKLLFAIIWFLPVQKFIDILRYPIGVEYSLIAFAIFLMNKSLNKDSYSSFKNKFQLLTIVIIFILSVWVSDLAIFTIVVLLLILLIFNYVEGLKINFSKTYYLYYFVFGVIACFVFIKYAKTFAVVKNERYLSINNLDSIKTAILLIKKSFIEVLFFKSREIFVRIYFYCVILFLISLLAYILKKKIILFLFSNKWFSFFIADFIVIFAILVLSSWVLANGMGGWYFVASYISLSIAVIIAVEHLHINNYSVNIFRYFLFIIAIIGAISPVYNMKHLRPKTLRPMVDVIGEFKQLGRIGIIADYWDSYIISCPNPEMVKATPCEQCGSRNQELVDEVFNQKSLYVIKDCWMDLFPDTLMQFGHVLLKEGKQFELANCQVCKYIKLTK